MGIYDREYIRSDARRPAAPVSRGLRAAGMWSVNTWIIVICAAVFVIDGFLPPRWVSMETRRLDTISQEDWDAIDRSVLVEGTLTSQPGRLAVRPLYLDTGAGRVQVGREILLQMPLLQSFLHFSTQRGFFQVEFWRLVGFQFLHAHMAHLLFNMLGLFFFGPMVERYLGSKRYLAFYLLCGIFGALMYVLLNLGGMMTSMMVHQDVRIPGLLFDNPATPLIGASAGVYGVIMAGAYLAPKAIVLVFFILPMRLATLSWVIVGIAFLTVLTGGQNAGGEAGHLGGALAGFYFIRHPKHLHGFFDFLGRLDPTSHHYRGVKRRRPGEPGRRSEIDRILDKISAKGLHSLTESEKRSLREQSRGGRD